MKAISIKQPWASYVAGGHKVVECRTWSTAYRGPLLICASKGDSIAKDEQGESILYGGLALGVVEIVDIRPMTKADLEKAFLPKEWHADALKGLAWHLKPLYEIIPFSVKGRLNLFDVDDALLVRLPEGYEDHSEYLEKHPPQR
mgnify:CR=1 FL=1